MPTLPVNDWTLFVATMVIVLGTLATAWVLVGLGMLAVKWVTGLAKRG